MKYDFTSVLDRKGKDAMAWEKIPIDGASVAEGWDTIPMWVADMNFATAPSVTEAVIGRLGHPVFGYFRLREEYFDSIIRWQESRNGLCGLKREYIAYENSVLGGVVSALGVLCQRGDNVLLHSPTYIGFTSSLRRNGYNIVLSPLIKDSSGIWRMDFADMEKKIREQRIHTAVFCSPHNPLGRVWEPEELSDMLELMRKYDVYVISDEIWSDLTLPGYRHTTLLNASPDAADRVILECAPSKTFNIAGIVGSYRICLNETLQDRLCRESKLSHYNEPNVLSMYALMGGYSEAGAEWLDELRSVLGANVDWACDFIQRRLKGVEVSPPQGTYMLFLDVSGWCESHGRDLDCLLRKGVSVGVLWQDGRAFNGPAHIRMNLALPNALVKEAFARLESHVFNTG